VTILFDLDGTLIDSTEAILESFHHSYSVYERPSPDDETIKALIGYPLDVMYRELGIEEVMIEPIVRTYKMHYRKISREKTLLLEGAREAVEVASEFAKLGVVTTKTAKYSRELLEHFGLLHYFEVLVGREDVENPKPHAEPIEKAISIMQSKKENSWMIGDTRLDIESAQNAAIKCVAVTTGYDNPEQLSTLIDIIKKDVLEAVHFIRHEGRNNTFQGSKMRQD